MAELKCGVENCSYNQENYCCKGDIMVGAVMPATVTAPAARAFPRDVMILT